MGLNWIGDYGVGDNYFWRKFRYKHYRTATPKHKTEFLDEDCTELIGFKANPKDPFGKWYVQEDSRRILSRWKSRSWKDKTKQRKQWSC